MSLINKSLFLGMALGTTLSLFSASCLSVCLGLELNLLCFIPFLANYGEQGSNTSLKYFLIQACGSLILLVMGMSSFWVVSSGGVETSSYLISVALLLKIGSAPLHWWYLNVLTEIKWGAFYILSVFQKIAPLALIYYSSLFQNSVFLLAVVTLCGLVGAVGGIAELSMRKILGYSSVSHLGWMFMPITCKSMSCLVYFLIYSFLVASLILSSWSNQVYHLTQSSSKKLSKVDSMSLIFGLFSIMGIPPFTGFVPKWMVLKDMMNSIPWGLLYFMIFMNIITLFYYLRWSISTLFFSFYLQKLFVGKTLWGSFSLMFNSLGLILLGGIWTSFLH